MAEAGPAARLRVLVVDDEPVNVKLIERRLKASCDITTASDGEEAVAFVVDQGREYDVILLDECAASPAARLAPPCWPPARQMTLDAPLPGAGTCAAWAAARRRLRSERTRRRRARGRWRSLPRPATCGRTQCAALLRPAWMAWCVAAPATAACSVRFLEAASLFCAFIAAFPRNPQGGKPLNVMTLLADLQAFLNARAAVAHRLSARPVRDREAELRAQDYTAMGGLRIFAWLTQAEEQQ